MIVAQSKSTNSGIVEVMYHLLPKSERPALRTILRWVLFSVPMGLAIAMFGGADLVAGLAYMFGASPKEFVFEFIGLAAPPLVSVQLELMLIVGFALYLCLISCRELPVFAPSYVSSRLLPKILESGRRWMSLVVGDTRILHSPNMTNRWFVYPERTTNQGTRYLPGDSLQLE